MTSPPNVTTAQYSLSRQGANTNETCLTPAGVLANGLSMAASLPGDGSPVYAEPLYVSGATIAGHSQTKNIVVIATLGDSVYVYDADTFAPYWSTNLISNLGDCNGTGTEMPTPATSVPQAGILSTPVINTDNYNSPMTVTVVGGCQTAGANPVPSWYLHILNLADGSSLTTTQISATVDVTDYPAGCVTTLPLQPCPAIQFSAQYQLQRPALTQVHTTGNNTEIYVGFGVASMGEVVPTNLYHGWLVGYGVSSTGSATQNFQFASTPTGAIGNSPTSAPYCSNPTTGGTPPSQLPANNLCGRGGGIWQGGKGFVYYAGRLFVCTGNGGFQPGLNWGSSCLAFTTSSTAPVDSFTPYWATGLPPYDGVTAQTFY
jgi:hypothetical protein